MGLTSEHIPFSERIEQRTLQFINIRWIAVSLLLGLLLLLHVVFKVDIENVKIFLVSLAILFYNAFLLILIKKKNVISEAKEKVAFFQRLVFWQIIADYISLTVILHFTGGLENPFVIYYVFHMVVASILLPVRKSLFLTTLALTCLGTLSFLEAFDIIPHYSIGGYFSNEKYRDISFLTTMGFVFASTSYILVFLTESIASKLRKQEKMCRLVNIELNRKDKVKDEYVFRITHDIKGHLSAIQSSLEVVNKGLVGELNPKQKQFINTAFLRTNKLSAFVKELLHLNQMRLENHFKAEVFQLEKIIEEVILTSREDAQSKNIKIIYNVLSDKCFVKGDALSIKEVLYNLIGNAIKYSPIDTAVTVNLVKENNAFYKCEVIDQGIGIPENEIPKLFVDFFRATNAKEKSIEGTGIGLSIVKQIILQHGGKIFVKSKINRGSTFWFQLPISNNVP